MAPGRSQNRKERRCRRRVADPPVAQRGNGDIPLHICGKSTCRVSPQKRGCRPVFRSVNQGTPRGLSLLDAINWDCLALVVGFCDLPTLQALRATSIALWVATRERGTRLLSEVAWDTATSHSRGFSHDSAGRIVYPNGAICIGSSQVVGIRSLAEQSARSWPLVDFLSARFRVSGNACWGCGLQPLQGERSVVRGNSRDEDRYWDRYWQDQGKNGWCSAPLARSNDLPGIRQLHGHDLEVSVDATRGELVLQVDGKVRDRQDIVESLPARLVISGNYGTVLTILPMTDEDLACLPLPPLPPSRRWGWEGGRVHWAA